MIGGAMPNNDAVSETSLDINRSQNDARVMSPSGDIDSPNPEDARDIDPSCCVQVAVRVRPLLALEGDDENCLQVLPPHPSAVKRVPTAIQVGGPAGPQFTFDQVFGMSADQIQVYESRVAPLITSCLDGYNATILAYGQTGSGVRSYFFFCIL
jgi:Kinesin motor domain